MHYSEIKLIENRNLYVNAELVNFLKAKILYLHRVDDGVELINTDTFNIVFKESSVSHIDFINDALFLSIKNELKALCLGTPNVLTPIYKIAEGTIRAYNAKYAVSKVSVDENIVGKIIRYKDNELIYEWNDDKQIINFDGDFPLFKTGDEALILYDLKQQKELWHLKFKHDLNLLRIIAQDNNQFFITTSYLKSDKRKIISVCKKSGKVSWSFGTTILYYCHDDVNNKLYGVEGKYFEQRNALTGEVERCTELDIKANIFSYQCYYNNGLLYFTTRLDGSIPVIGAINVCSRKIEFTQKVEVPVTLSKADALYLSRPLVMGNRLYVNDSMDYVHIFENSNTAFTKNEA